MVDVLNGRCMVQLIQRAAKGQLEVVGNLGQTQTLNRGGSGLLHGRAISSRVSSWERRPLDGAAAAGGIRINRGDHQRL